MKKTYVLDTNILLDSPNAVFGFEDNTVAVTATTLQELDSKKTAPGELGFNARESCRIIEGLRVKGICFQESSWIMVEYLRLCLRRLTITCQRSMMQQNRIIK